MSPAPSSVTHGHSLLLHPLWPLNQPHPTVSYSKYQPLATTAIHRRCLPSPASHHAVAATHCCTADFAVHLYPAVTLSVCHRLLSSVYGACLITRSFLIACHPPCGPSPHRTALPTIPAPPHSLYYFAFRALNPLLCDCQTIIHCHF